MINDEYKNLNLDLLIQCWEAIGKPENITKLEEIKKEINGAYTIAAIHGMFGPPVYIDNTHGYVSYKVDNEKKDNKK